LKQHNDDGSETELDTLVRITENPHHKLQVEISGDNTTDLSYNQPYTISCRNINITTAGGKTYNAEPIGMSFRTLDHAMCTNASVISEVVWSRATRTLTALDEDDTSIDLDASTIGTASVCSDLDGISGNVITAASIASGAIDADAIATDAIGAAEAGFLLDSTGFNGADIGSILTDTSAYDTDAEYAAAIWNAATASYGGAGTYGQKIEDVGTTTEIADAVWDEDATGHQTGGTFGAAIGDSADYDQGLLDMLAYNAADGNVETDLDSSGGTTPAAVWGYTLTATETAAGKAGYFLNQTYEDVGVTTGSHDQSIADMLSYSSADGNVETDLDSAGGTTPAAVWGYALTTGETDVGEAGYYLNQTFDIVTWLENQQ